MKCLPGLKYFSLSNNLNLFVYAKKEVSWQRTVDSRVSVLLRSANGDGCQGIRAHLRAQAVGEIQVALYSVNANEKTEIK